MTPTFDGHGIFDTMVQFFKDQKWNYHQMDGKTILRMGFTGENGGWHCVAQAKEEVDRFIFYSIMESRVPENKRAAVAEFLTRANYRLILGNFELDYEDGEVRFKTSIDVEGGALTTTMVKTLVYTNCLMMDKYLPGIMKVVYGGGSPAEAIAELEKK